MAFILIINICQVIIILWSGGLTEKISWLQYLVISKSLLMASKGPAMDYLEAHSRRQTSADGGTSQYLHQELAQKLPQLGENAIFAVLLFYHNYGFFRKTDAILLFPDHLPSSLNQPRNCVPSLHHHLSLSTLHTGNSHSWLPQSVQRRGLSGERDEVFGHNR